MSTMIKALPAGEMSIFSLLFTFILFLFIFLKVLRKSNSQSQVEKSPPGPWKLPILGNLHQLAGSLPHHRLNELSKKYGPIMKIQMGQVVSVIISSPAAAREVLKTNELNFAQRPTVSGVPDDYAGLFLAPHNDYWRQMRKICVLELLTVKRVNSFRSIREEEMWNAIESITSSAGEQVINLTRKMSAYTNNVISRAAFGGKCKDQDEFIAALKEVIVLVGGFHLADLFPSLAFLNYVNGTKKAANKVHEKTERILGGIINEHRIKRGTKVSRGDGESTEVEDIVDVFLRLQESEEFQISDSQIRYVIMDIFSGGSESISTSIDWAMVEMLRKPTVLKKAQTEVRQKLQGKKEIDEHVFEELNYLKAVVKESLRLHPSTALIARESMERCEINGYEIPKKTKVIVNAWATGRDEEHWVNADTFMPERFLDSSITYVGTNFELIPFGAGRRICPGFNFAIPTIELALAQLLYHFDWKLPNGIKPEELDMTETFGISTRRSTELHVIATPFSS